MKSDPSPPSDPLALRGPGGPGWDDMKLQKLWLATQRRDWRSLAVVGASKDLDTLWVAELIAKLAWWYRGQPSCVFDLRDLRLRLVEYHEREVTNQVGLGQCVVIALGPSSRTRPRSPWPGPPTPSSSASGSVRATSSPPRRQSARWARLRARLGRRAAAALHAGDQRSEGRPVKALGVVALAVASATCARAPSGTAGEVQTPGTQSETAAAAPSPERPRPPRPRTTTSEIAELIYDGG